MIPRHTDGLFLSTGDKPNLHLEPQIANYREFDTLKMASYASPFWSNVRFTNSIVFDFSRPRKRRTKGLQMSSFGEYFDVSQHRLFI